MCAVAALIGIALPAPMAQGGNTTTTATLVVFKVAFVLIGATLAALALRGAGAAVYADSDGITVRNVFRSRQVAWNQLREVTVGRRPFVPRIALVVVADGSALAAWGLSGDVVAAVARLNELRQAHT